MLGTRGIWHKGWKAVAEHGPVPARTRASSTRTAGSSSTPTRTAPRRTTSPSSTPRSCEELTTLWLEEAKKYNVLPLNDLGDLRVPRARVRHRRSRRAGSTPTTPARPRCPERRPPTRTASRTRSSPRSSSPPDSQGVIFAQGSRFGGHALFVKDGKLTYVYNFLGIPPEQQRRRRRARRRARTSSASSSPRSASGEHHESHGTLKLYVDDEVVAEAEIRTHGRPLRALRRGPVHRLRRRRRRQRASTSRSSRSPAAGSSRSSSTSPTTPTSTSSGSSPPPWRATEERKGNG